MDRKFIGSVFMVSGCAMGAGSLALPMLAAGPGFIWSSLFVILTGIFAYYVAIYTLELYMINKNGENISSVVSRNFGKSGVLFTAVVNLALMYAVIMVYLTAGADLLTKTLLPLININISPTMGLVIFLIIFVPVFINGTNLVVKSNTLVFYIKLISFVTAIVIGLTFVTPTIVIAPPEFLSYVPKALPIFFCALGFQFLVPVLAKYNDYERKRCKQILFCGVLLPVVLYVLWVAVMLSLVARDGNGNTFYSLLTNNESVGTMISYATNNNPNLPTLMKIALNTFSNVAVITSFLSVGISLYEYLRDALKIRQTFQGRSVNLLITLLPPAICALLFPNGFLFVLHQVAIFLVLVCAMPLVAMLKEYAKLEIKPAKISILLVLGVCALLIILQVMDDFSLLRSFGGINL